MKKINDMSLWFLFFVGFSFIVLGISLDNFSLDILGMIIIIICCVSRIIIDEIRMVNKNEE